MTMTMVIVVNVRMGVLHPLMLVLVDVLRGRIKTGAVVVNMVAVVVSMTMAVLDARVQMKMLVPIQGQRRRTRDADQQREDAGRRRVFAEEDQTPCERKSGSDREQTRVERGADPAQRHQLEQQ